MLTMVHGYALVLPVAVGGAPSLAMSLEETGLLLKRLVVHMVTHSELILIGQLIVSVLRLFVHIYNYNNEKK